MLCVLGGSPMHPSNRLLCGCHRALTCIPQYRHLQLYQHLSQLFTTQYANQIFQSLFHPLAPTVSLSRNPRRVFAMHIYIFPSPAISRSFLSEATVRSLCEIWNPHDIPADFSTRACLMTLSTSSSRTVCLLLTSSRATLPFLY